MKTSPAGRKAITQREGNKLKAYRDSVNVLTIGVGHTSAAGAPKVTAGLTITAAQSDEILSRDLAIFEKAVSNAVKVPLSQNQFDALVSLAFNIGGGAFAKSTLVKKLNAKDYAGAANAFLSWNKAKGKVLAGLTTRRKAERAQFLSSSAPATPVKPAVAKPAPEPKPIIEKPPAGVDRAMVRAVQKHLKELGYNPGGFDGLLGPLTREAILAFSNDNGLTPPDDNIDAEFLTALYTAKPRAMVPARANATPAEVAAKVPETKANWWNKIGGLFGGGGLVATGGVSGLLDYTEVAKGYLEPIRDFFADVPVWVWAIVFGVILLAVWRTATKVEAKSVEAWQSGDRR